MITEVKVLQKQGQAAIVTFRDKDGMLQARIISADDVAGHRRGDTTVISSKILEKGTEYGMDVEILLGEETIITAKDFQEALRRHGIWTYDDLNKNSPGAIAAINSLSKRFYAALLHEAREIS